MSAPSSSIDVQVQALLRAQEMSGERLVNKIRFVYGLAGLGMAIAAAEVNTPAANQVFLVQGTALVVACVLLFAFFRATRDAWFPWLKYLTIAFDIGIVHLAVVASARNHSGVIEYFHSFFPLILVLWNLLSGLRTSVAACLWSAFVTAAMGSVVLAMVLHYELVPISATSVWGQNALNIADEGMRLAFCQRNVQAARADLTRICAEIREELESEDTALEAAVARALPGAEPEPRPARTMAGAVYVSCAGRGGPHFGGPGAELQIVRRALGDVPLVGFFAGGEIAHSRLYGYTGVLTVFAAPR